ncbi:hypothetical protein [Nitrosomonas supralitoralis]|uniref:hypothetical protein n=1 Tax=Nitrosomonas supralitoralis TaxID=2116706 RepID=UPI001559CDE7|nr:hypothetical protein [Nitrosomonas supralitoralis]
MASLLNFKPPSFSDGKSSNTIPDNWHDILPELTQKEPSNQNKTTQVFRDFMLVGLNKK